MVLSNSTAIAIQYNPAPPPTDPALLPTYLQQEHTKIKAALDLLGAGYDEIVYAPPAKPRLGMRRYADGAQWNPGSGHGMYHFDGAQWVKTSGIVVSINDFMSAEQRMDAHLRIGSIDMTGAFNAAIAVLRTNGGGKLTSAPGVYYHAPVFINFSNFSYEGAGRGVTVHKLKASPLANQGPVFNVGIESNFSTTVAVSNISLSGFTVDGNKLNQKQGATNADGGNGGVYSWKFDGLTVENVDVHDCDGYGFGFVGSGLTPRRNLTVKNCNTYNNAYDGLDIKSGLDTGYLENITSYNNGPGPDASRDSVGLDLRGNDVHAVSLRSYGCQIGIRIRDNAGDRVSGHDWYAYSNRQDGIHVNGLNTGRYKLTACRAELNTRYGILHSNGALDLVACEARANVADGLVTETVDAGENTRVIGGNYDSNGQDGIRCTGAAGRLVISGGASVKGNARYGINTVRPFSVSDAEILNNTGPGILMSSVPAGWVLRDTQLKDLRTSGKTQNYALQFSGAVGSGSVNGCDVTGNGTGPVVGTIPAGTRIVNTVGLASQTNGETATFAVDSTGVKSVGFTHGLNFTPSVNDVLALLIRDTNVDDYQLGWIRVTGTSSSIVSLQVRVMTASATVGATAKLGISIDCSVR